MATNRKRLHFAVQHLKKGRYRELLQLAGNRLGLESSREITSAARFQPHKRKAINSFLEFLDGGEQPRWPLEVFIEVSNLCDLQCAMCHTFSALNPKRFNIISHRHRGFFDADLIEERMAQVLEHALVVHAFGYGEPTLHPEFNRLLEILDKYEVMVDFFTHGMHLNEQMCEDLVSKHISKITVSFSGADCEDYENVYIGGEFDKVMAGIHRLHNQKQKQQTTFPLIVINSQAFKHHVDKLPAFVRMMGEAGANVIHLKPFKTYDIIEELHGYASVHHPDHEGRILEQARRIAAEYGIRLESADYESDQEDGSVLQSRHMGTRPLSTQGVPIAELKNIARKNATAVDWAKRRRKKSKFRFRTRMRWTTGIWKTWSAWNLSKPCISAMKAPPIPAVTSTSCGEISKNNRPMRSGSPISCALCVTHLSIFPTKPAKKIA